MNDGGVCRAAPGFARVSLILHKADNKSLDMCKKKHWCSKKNVQTNSGRKFILRKSPPCPIFLMARLGDCFSIIQERPFWRAHQAGASTTILQLEVTNSNFFTRDGGTGCPQKGEKAGEISWIPPSPPDGLWFGLIIHQDREDGVRGVA